MLIATILWTDLYNSVSHEIDLLSSNVFQFKPHGMSETRIWRLMSLQTNLAAIR